MLQRLVLGASWDLWGPHYSGLLAPFGALGRGSDMVPCRQADAGSQDAAAGGDAAHEENVVRGSVVRSDGRTRILYCFIRCAVGAHGGTGRPANHRSGFMAVHGRPPSIGSK